MYNSCNKIIKTVLQTFGEDKPVQNKSNLQFEQNFLEFPLIEQVPPRRHRELTPFWTPRLRLQIKINNL